MGRGRKGRRRGLGEQGAGRRWLHLARSQRENRLKHLLQTWRPTQREKKRERDALWESRWGFHLSLVNTVHRMKSCSYGVDLEGLDCSHGCQSKG